MKKLTRNQFSVYIAVATSKVPARAGEIASRAGVVWHSANVALRRLADLGMVERDEESKTFTARQIVDLGAVIFVQAGESVESPKAATATAKGGIAGKTKRAVVERLGLECMTVESLASDLGRHPSTIRQSLRRLEDQGIVERVSAVEPFEAIQYRTVAA